MGAALLAAIFCSMSVVCAGRSTRLVGGTGANLARLAVGIIILAVYAHVFGGGCRGRGFIYFVASGVIGLGVGDVAMFQALPRLGSRLTILLVQCLAAPFGAFIEWLWLGTTLSPFQLSGGGLILFGVAVALWPGSPVAGARLWSGAAWGAFAAFGQGAGAVISRRASGIDALSGSVVDGATAAYQRLIGGIAISAVVFLVVRAFRRNPAPDEKWEPPRWKPALPWIVANGVLGLVFGVACYQWALRETATGIVLSIVATTPLLTIPLAWIVEGDRPGWHAFAGGLVAVGGIILLRST